MRIWVLSGVVRNVQPPIYTPLMLCPCLMKTRYKIEFVKYLVIRLIMLCPCLMETRYKIHLIMLCLQPLPKLFRFNI